MIDEVGGDAALDDVPEQIDLGGLEQALRGGAGRLLQRVDRRGDGLNRRHGDLVLAMGVGVGHQADRRQEGHGILEVHVAKNLAGEFLLEGPSGGLVADHGPAEGDDLMHREEVALEPPGRQECEGPAQAVTGDPERPVACLHRLGDPGKHGLPDHMERLHETAMEPGAHPCRREVCADPSFGQDQVVVGVGQQPVLEPVQRMWVPASRERQQPAPCHSPPDRPGCCPR